MLQSKLKNYFLILFILVSHTNCKEAKLIQPFIKDVVMYIGNAIGETVIGKTIEKGIDWLFGSSIEQKISKALKKFPINMLKENPLLGRITINGAIRIKIISVIQTEKTVEIKNDSILFFRKKPTSSNWKVMPMTISLIKSKITAGSVQLALERAGFPPGDIDGIIGPETKAAILKYQQMINIRATGELDETTRISLIGE